MPDRPPDLVGASWVRAARRCAPRALRGTVFDPELADLQRDWLSGRQPMPGWLGRWIAGFGLALECRRLAARERLSAMATGVSRESLASSFVADLRRAAVALVRRPLFAVVAVAILALGIGGNVAVFSCVDAFLLVLLPVQDAARVVRVYPVTPAGARNVTSYPTFADLRRELPGLELAAAASTSVLLTDNGLTDNRTAELVTGGYFHILGLRPLLGRLLGTPAQAIGSLSLEVPLDWRVAGFTFLLALVAGLTFGLGTAWRAARLPALAVLKDEAGTTAGGRTRSRWRRTGVIVQVAASTVLLLVAALLGGGLLRAETITPGFETGHLALVSFRLPPSALAPGAQAFTPKLVAAVRALPGVAAADVTRSVPLEPGCDTEGVVIPGHVEPDGAPTQIDDAAVGAGYFDALGLTLLRGRPWDSAAEGRRTAVGSVVINETMAKRFWGDRDPVGSLVTVEGPAVVTGVVRDSVYYEIGEAPMPFVYLPAESVRPNAYTLVVRTSVDVAGVLPSLTRAANQVDPSIVAASAYTFDSMRSDELAPERLLVSGATVFGLVVLLLSGVGLYGVVAASVAARTREIGVRLALGARADRVLASVLGDALALVAVGTVVGLGAGLAAAGSLRSWLAGMNPLSPSVVGLVVILLAVTAVAAAWLPARSAARVDPVTALREG